MGSIKWQCSEEQARAVYAEFKGSTQFASARDGMRAAITAAVGPEVDALRDALRVLAKTAHDVYAAADGREPWEEMCDAVKAARAVLEKTGGGE